MTLIPLDIPTGFYRNGTDLEQAGRWRDGSRCAGAIIACANRWLAQGKTHFPQTQGMHTELLNGMRILLVDRIAN